MDVWIISEPLGGVNETLKSAITPSKPSHAYQLMNSPEGFAVFVELSRRLLPLYRIRCTCPDPYESD